MGSLALHTPPENGTSDDENQHTNPEEKGVIGLKIDGTKMACVVDKKREHWRYKAENHLFPALKLAKVFRAKVFDVIKALGLKAKETLP